MMPPGALLGPQMMMSRAGHTASLRGSRRRISCIWGASLSGHQLQRLHCTAVPQRSTHLDHQCSVEGALRPVLEDASTRVAMHTQILAYSSRLGNEAWHCGCFELLARWRRVGSRSL